MDLDPAVAFLRHILATLAYRGAKTLRDAPEGFASFQASAGTRTPVQILAHIGDLFDWALTMADGRMEWRNSAPLPWENGVARFFDALGRFDARLAGGVPLGMPVERLFQAPVADALTHFGQIAMLRRMAAAPVRGEDYLGAEIVVGRVGPTQAEPKFEFD